VEFNLQRLSANLKRHLANVNWPEVHKLLTSANANNTAKAIFHSTMWANPMSAEIVTPAHFDNSNAMHCVFQGNKTFRFFHPSLTPHLLPYPNFHPMKQSTMPFIVDEVTKGPPVWKGLLNSIFNYSKVAIERSMQVLVREGECVFMPGFWWHEVTTASRTVSASFVLLEGGEFDASGEHMRNWKTNPLHKWRLLWSLETWVRDGFLHAFRDTGDVFNLVSDFFIAADNEAYNEWGSVGSQLVQFLLRRISHMELKLTETELIHLLRAIGHRRYEILGTQL